MKKLEDTNLTQREQDVLILVARGFTNKEIADHLCTSTSAVKVFLHQACVKLGARNRAQAVILAMRRGAIQTEDAFSLEEIADLLASLGPEAIQTIAKLVKQRLEQSQPPSGIDPAQIDGILSFRQ